MPKMEKDQPTPDYLTRIATIRYNPAARAFEAAVALYDAGEVFTYPVSLRAPMDADYETVTRSLAEMACRHHARGRTEFRAQRREQLLDHVPPKVQAATSALWDRLLNRAA